MLLLYKFCVVNVFCQIYLRARWLKDLNPEAEQLFSMVAEVFIFWAKSHVRMIQCFYLFVFLMPMPSQWIFCPLTVTCLRLCSLQQNFKWEEQNYVVQNEINNLSFLTNNDKTFKVGHIYNLTSSITCVLMYISLQNICRNHRRIAAATKCKEKNPVFIWSQYSAWQWEEEDEEEEGVVIPSTPLSLWL